MNQTSHDDNHVHTTEPSVIYLAGGRFWAMQKLLDCLRGVVETTCGYANGHVEHPSREQVESDTTGARETVRVTYDPAVVSLDTILYAFFSVIDPTVSDAQGKDKGKRFQTGIYFTDDAIGRTAKRIAATEEFRYHDIATEVKPLESFYEADEDQQHYLDKNPDAPCRISDVAFDRIANLIVDAGPYRAPADDDEAWASLTPTAYDVTRIQGTEPYGSSDFYQSFEPGLYVDVVTGEPLFSSADKFPSTCGWPSFCKPIDPNVLRPRVDKSFGMTRIELSSRVGSSHLGHLYLDDEESPNGMRYCINGAAMRFIPRGAMKDRGYGDLLEYVPMPSFEEAQENEVPKKRRGFFSRRAK